MRTASESTSTTHTDITRASTAGGANESAVVSHTVHTAKAQHALSLFANLRADLCTSTSLQSSKSAAHAASEARASSATRCRTSAPSSYAHTLDTHARLTSSTSAASPNADAVRFSTLHDLQRSGISCKADDAVAPQAYTEAELEMLSPVQLRHQLRVAAAVTQRLHQRSQRLEKEVDAWKHKYAGLEAKTAAEMREVGIDEGKLTERQTFSASLPDGTHPHQSIVAPSSLTAAVAATASALAATQSLEVTEARSRQLETEVKRLTAHKQELTKRLYVAEQTVGALKEKLRIMAAISPATSSAASSPLGVAKTTAGESASDKSRSKALESGATTTPTRAPPSPSGTATKSEMVDPCSDGTVCVDGAGGESFARLRSTVRELQRRLDLSEARVEQAEQIHLDALLLHRESTPSAVALVNAEVQKLFQLMQQQLLSNAVQQQAERARMSELLYQLQCQQRAP
ncbi:hypothetical protein NXY56_007011 [Leishmania guyanensis]|uniref:Uncharacterized protein n=3 Tax=Leishmania guyanensis species complex TaxID=38579 RepID=A0A1E1IVG2_LEIGU